MSIGREAIYAQLLTTLSTAAGTTVAERFFRDIDSVSSSDMPYLSQVEVSEAYKQVKGQPPQVSLSVMVRLYTYNGNGSQDIAWTQLNTMLDAIETALAPDPATNLQSLGGLVYHCWINGQIQKYAGMKDKETKAIAEIPIEILVTGSTAQNFSFDTGTLYAQDLSNPNATPIKFGSLEGVDISIDFKTTEAKYNFQIAYKSINNMTSIKGKAKFARFNGAILNQIVFGQALVSGSNGVLVDQVGTIGSGPFTVTPVIPNSGTYLSDLGVTYDSGVSVGTVLKFVTTAPSQGQYSLSGGVYTFNSADAGVKVLINCLYSQSTGNKLALVNTYQQVSGVFKLVLVSGIGSSQNVWVLNNASSDLLTFATKLEDFTIPEFSFFALADASGNVGTFSFAQ